MNYWLVKSEPASYSIDDFARDKTTCWDGVRNYQARNFLRDGMKKGDRVFFYHSNCDAPGIVGVAEVVKEGYPDAAAFDRGHKYFDEKSDPARPVWYMVDLKLKKRFRRTVTLEELRGQAELKEMKLLAKGNRLSVLPVASEEWERIMAMAAE